jgi:hypothetical protein
VSQAVGTLKSNPESKIVYCPAKIASVQNRTLPSLGLFLGRSIIFAIAIGIPARMCHRSPRNFLVMGGDAVLTAASLLGVRTIKATVRHTGILNIGIAGHNKPPIASDIISTWQSAQR